MKKVLLFAIIMLVIANNASLVAQKRIKMGPGPVVTKSSMPLKGLPPAPQPGLFDVTSVNFKNLNPAQKSAEILKKLYDIVLDLQENFATFKLTQYGNDLKTIKLEDVQPLLFSIESAIIDLGPTVGALGTTLLELKPSDVRELKKLKALAVKPADAALSLSKPALSLETPGQKAFEEKRVKAVKEARKKLYSTAQ